METQERKTIDNMSPTEWIQTVMVLPYIWDHLYFTLHTSASPSGRFFLNRKCFTCLLNLINYSAPKLCWEVRA